VGAIFPPLGRQYGNNNTIAVLADPKSHALVTTGRVSGVEPGELIERIEIQEKIERLPPGQLHFFFLISAFDHWNAKVKILHCGQPFW